VVKQIDGRQVMLLSYWDGGYVQLDMTNPLAPVYLSDSDFPVPDSIAGEQYGFRTPEGELVGPEGNAHQAEFAGVDDAFVLAADEDFSPIAADAETVSGERLTVSSGSDTPNIEEGALLSGTTKFVGRACNADAAVPAPTDGATVAVVERGLCTFTEKVQNVQRQPGYTAILIFNRTGSDACNAAMGMTVEGAVPTFGVAPREQGYDLFGAAYDDAACKAGDGTQTAVGTGAIVLGAIGEGVKFSSYFDGWGYVRLLDAGTMGELDTYAIPEAHKKEYAEGYGDLSVHEVAVSAVDPEIAYVSYYSGGARAISVAGGKITEIAAYIDEEGDGGNNFWGVEVFQQAGVEYVALSDRDFGLYILKLAP
jgi:hypothetical protein